MSAVVVSVPTNYYSLTDASGNVNIRGVPPGRYMLHIWNERALPGASVGMTREIIVSGPATSFAFVSLPISMAADAPHKNKYGRDYDPSAPANPIYEQH
jgi:hypothetical protein